MRRAYRALMLAAAAAAVPAVVSAQTAGVKPFRFGAQIDYGTEVEAIGVGARVEYSLASMVPSLTDFRFVGSFDWFFPDAIDYFEINAGVATSFPMSGGAMTPYAGAGLNYARASADVPGFGSVSNSEVGLNIMGGLRFRPMGSLVPFVEARLELGGGEQFVISGGLLFF